MAGTVDEEIQAFIDSTDSFYPPDAVDGSIDQQRDWYNTMCRAFRRDYPENVTAEDEVIPGKGGDIPVRRYRNKWGRETATVVYLHGGGFVVGDLESHDDVCAEICDKTGFQVVAVDYRLAPEHVHPAAFDDAYSAFETVAAEGRPIVMVGDSAGGCLAASVSVVARDKGDKRIAGQVLIYPALGGSKDSPSRQEHAEAPMLTTRDMDYYGHVRSGGGEPEGDPTYYALAASDFAGLPPTIMFAAEIDPLRDDCVEFAEKLDRAGVHAEAHIHLGLVHGHLRARHVSDKAGRAFEEICFAVGRLGQ
ncbi:alpha/beta hydrolase [Aestuariispira ectoiniformans]|uniref:alpha/beta hydrolase n=1 Tax=Aestuariispira ectoiniformans TaxID=2775080 RepID=UPI00223B03D6|nr:alpha/beta hydrolase [Aestuariispira ectoiniformans]